MTDEKKPTASISDNSNHSLDQRPESPQRPPKIPRISVEEDGDRGDFEQPKEPILVDDTMSQKNPRLQRYLVAIEYIGTRFAGAQKQPNDRTVVGVLEDAGVHALSNVCHVDVERISKRRPGEVLPPHEPAVVRRAVNHFLQKNEGDIMVIDVRCVTPDFHARYKAQERTYFYRLLSGPEPLSIFEKDRAWHVPEELDILAMQRACRVLVGHHDFSSFRAASCQAKSPIRTLDEISVTEVVSTPYFPSLRDREVSISTGDSLLALPTAAKIDPLDLISEEEKVINPNGESNCEFGMRRRHHCYVVTTRACSFLYHQVRLLVGVLKCVGTGELTISDVERILNAKSVTAASPMAPACGLYLGRVKYDLSSDMST
ncbi:uncharacterized protein LOC131306398 isoform X2 [Rhododendron vialii]|uniref:uncharacterized protein LOC131306398 isoform X2 n=1 Tax=Rhododendron vialii TaxID=182163 RepID=UPI00265DE948|nr:uncharacterized protein LOC131306398 isoform X2 [Rhododendron vialii]